MSISAQDRERISSAIHAAEEKTSGEIVCVLAQTSSDATALPVLMAAIAALALPWLLVALTAMTVQRSYLYRSNSGRFLVGNDEFTFATLGTRMMPATGAMSRMGLKFSFSYSVALTAFATTTRSSV